MINVTEEEKLWPALDSNPRPLAYRASTLPTELPSSSVAQLVECSHGKQEPRGSSRGRATIFVAR